MTIGGTRAVLATALLLLSGVPALAGQGEDRAAKNNTREAEDVREESGARVLAETERARRRATGTVRSAAAAQGFSASPGMRAELFGRGALSLLNVSAEDSFAFSFGPNTEGETLAASRLVSEAGWGGGLRLMSGDWGVEGTYTILESLALSPTWLVADDMGAGGGPAAGLLDLPLVASRAGVMLGQVVRNFRLSGGRTEIFVGLGAGWMRVTDSSTDRLVSGTAVQDARDRFLRDLPPDIPSEFVPEVEFTADRNTVAYVGSLGVAFRVGRVLLRPRADVIISPALTTDLTVRLADLDVPLLDELGSFEISYGTSVKPTIFLISVDIGLGN